MRINCMSRSRIRNGGLALLTTVSVMGLLGTGVAVAAVPSNTTAHPTLSSVSPNSFPGGGGYEYSDSEEGNCGVSSLGVNDLGGGKIQAQVELTSTQGTMKDGHVTISWGGGGLSGSKTWQPVGDTWESPVTDFDVPQHTEIVVLVSGYVTLIDGDSCSIENPNVSFESS